MKHRLAFLYNVRHRYPDSSDQQSHKEADFDDPGTISAMISHLKSIGEDVLPVEANEDAYEILKKHRKAINLVFNYSLGINGKDRYSHIPAICEMLEIPYTGSSPLTQATVMTKAQTKTICKAYGIPTLPWQVFERETQDLEAKLEFPLIVKPIAQGSSAGITNESVVKNKRELKKQITFILDTFNEPALVEPFIRGREFSVGLLGNPPRILPIIEADHSTLPKGYEPLDSLEVKWIVEEQASSNHLICPAIVPPSLREKLESMCLSLWNALNIQDFCRMDVRCDLQGNPFILEVNSPPGLIPPEISKTGYLPVQAKYSGMSYDELLKNILLIARKRLGIYLYR